MSAPSIACGITLGWEMLEMLPSAALLVLAVGCSFGSRERAADGRA